MAEVLTIDGEKMRQEAEATGGVLELDTFVLAQLPGQDPADPIDRTRGLPGDDQVVATYPVTRRAAVDENTVVYSLFLGTDVGPYRFNTLYLCSGNRVHSIVTIPATDKVADDLEHGIRGSNMTRNIVLVFDGAQSLTQISVDAEAWQWDFDQATDVTRGLVEIATAEEVNAGADIERVVTPATLAARLATVTPPPASTDVPGIAELATQEEVSAGTDAARIVTPATLAARLATVTPPPASTDVPGIAELATPEEAAAGADAVRVVTPAALAGVVATKANASHRHPWGEVDGIPATASRWPSWGEVSGIPATASRWPSWGEVSGKPADRTRKITVSTSGPSGGAEGDIWLKV